jgi:serine O-acetyltransferase
MEQGQAPHPTIGDHVVVGAGAKTFGPVTLGERVKVGANSVVIRDVPKGRTVVGIPARVVRTESSPHLNPYGGNLDHHLMSDPVTSAVACLLDRIRLLEKQVGVHSCVPGGSAPRTSANTATPTWCASRSRTPRLAPRRERR